MYDPEEYTPAERRARKMGGEAEDDLRNLDNRARGGDAAAKRALRSVEEAADEDGTAKEKNRRVDGALREALGYEEP